VSNAPIDDARTLDSGVHKRRPVGSPPRVLIVDDEPLIADVLARLLADEFHVECATDGETALDILERVATEGKSFDAIVCDLTMPNVSGMDLYDRLAISLPDAAARMIFMTGGAVTARARAFVASTTNVVIDKPIDMVELRAALERCVRGGDDERNERELERSRRTA
jgi:CheY-like chemotaxis protein